MENERILIQIYILYKSGLNPDFKIYQFGLGGPKEHKSKPGPLEIEMILPHQKKSIFHQSLRSTYKSTYILCRYNKVQSIRSIGT